MFGGLASSSTTPNTWPTCSAVTGLRCGSSIQCVPWGGCFGARTSMMLPTVPPRSIAGPPAPGLKPEKRVTKASPGCNASCASDGTTESEMQPATAVKMEIWPNATAARAGNPNIVASLEFDPAGTLAAKPAASYGLGLHFGTMHRRS